MQYFPVRFWINWSGLVLLHTILSRHWVATVSAMCLHEVSFSARGCIDSGIDRQQFQLGGRFGDLQSLFRNSAARATPRDGIVASSSQEPRIRDCTSKTSSPKLRTSLFFVLL